MTYLERLRELLIGAAECFEKGTSPFNTDWLVANDVSLYECQDLQGAIGFAIRFFVKNADRRSDLEKEKITS